MIRHLMGLKALWEVLIAFVVKLISGLFLSEIFLHRSRSVGISSLFLINVELLSEFFMILLACFAINLICVYLFFNTVIDIVNSLFWTNVELASLTEELFVGFRTFCDIFRIS